LFSDALEADIVDLLGATLARDLPLGVTTTTGLCDERGGPGYSTPKLADASRQALKISEQAQLSLSTAQIFNGKREML
jgi:hypothetical protein